MSLRFDPARALKALCLICLLGCTKDMAIQDRLQAQNHVMPDPLPNTLASDRLNISGGVVRAQKPVNAKLESASFETLRRGQERYNIHCSPCHDRAGLGQGMVVLSGFKRPPALTDDVVRGRSDKELFEIISDDIDRSHSFRRMITTEDRWAIVAFIRALQLSQRMPIKNLEPRDLEDIEKERGK